MHNTSGRPGKGVAEIWQNARIASIQYSENQDSTEEGSVPDHRRVQGAMFFGALEDAVLHEMCYSLREVAFGSGSAIDAYGAAGCFAACLFYGIR